MKDISILIPLHKFDDAIFELLKKSLKSVASAQGVFDGKLTAYIIYPEAKGGEVTKAIKEKLKGEKGLNKFVKFIHNTTGKTDFCSQINLGVESVDTEYFSILEFDDEYLPNWFKNAQEYYFGNDDISVYLPINLIEYGDDGWEYGNTMALSPTFVTSNENDNDDIGIINEFRIKNCSLFNLTGAIFNTKNFKEIGKLKPSIKVAFNYEFLLRMTNNGFKGMVIPKLGYIHNVGRSGSLTEEYLNNTTREEREKWFTLASIESQYKEDRNKDIEELSDSQLK